MFPKGNVHTEENVGDGLKPTPPAETRAGLRAKQNIVDTPKSTLPTAARIANQILGVEIVKYHETETGGVIVITGQGQKFTFTAEQLKAPEAAKAELKRNKVKVFTSLPHGPMRIPQPEE